MIDPTDTLAKKFDDLKAMSAQRGWSTTHVHPTRYVETLRIEKLEAERGGATRTTAVRATVRLRPEPDADRFVFVQISACVLTGRYDITYFDESGLLLDSRTGDVAYHKLYLERRDAQQALGTGYDLAVLNVLVRILREGGHTGLGEELSEVLKVKRGQDPSAAGAPAFPFALQLDL